MGISWSTTNPFSFIKLFDRSSLAAQGLEIKAGVIDSDYTGEIILLIKNTTDSSITILAGDKVCQGAILERVNVSRYAWSKEGEFFEQYNPVSVEVRKGGFGSTGR